MERYGLSKALRLFASGSLLPVDALAISPATLASLVIALSFAAGLNVYATVCSLGLMARLHWIVLPGELGALQNTWIIAVSAALFAGEFVADKIPGFDLIWNALHTFIRIPAAALMAYAASYSLPAPAQRSPPSHTARRPPPASPSPQAPSPSRTSPSAPPKTRAQSLSPGSQPITRSPPESPSAR
jgi:hypothetical protein